VDELAVWPALGGARVRAHIPRTRQPLQRLLITGPSARKIHRQVPGKSALAAQCGIGHAATPV